MEINIQSLNTIQEIETLRNELNNKLNERRLFVESCIIGDMLSKKSFGYIKECFENISPELFNTSNGKKIIKEYTDLIKNNKNLSALHAIYENLRKADKNADVEFLINTITTTNWGIDSNSLNEDTYKLGRVLAEGVIYLGTECSSLLPEENKTYSDAVEYIVENNINKKNIVDYSNAIKIIKEHISKRENPTKIELKSVNLDTLAESLINKFNETYTEKLSETEFLTLKELCESKNREDVFNKYKHSCIESLNSVMNTYATNNNTEAVSKIQNLIEQVSKKEYSLDTITTDITKFIEITDIFEN